MSEVQVRAEVPETRDVEVLAVPWFEDRAESGEWWEGPAAAWLDRKRVGGATEPAGWVTIGDGMRPDLWVARISPKGRSETTAIRQTAGEAVRAARERGASSVGLLLPAHLADVPAAGQAGVEGLLLGDWEYDALRDAQRRRPAPGTRIVYARTEKEEAAGERQAWLARGQALARAQNAARELIALPGNIVTPRHLADTARELGERYGFSVQAWGEEKLRAEGFGALLAVAKGSAEEPFFLILEHAGEGGDPCVVVGKGVTFDAGGISIKPSEGMEDMKYDMSGAAATIGTLVAAAELDIPQRVVGLIPTTENLPSGTAVKPGDVIRGLSGTSIEVINTDAEGRLILSDALTFAQRLSPAAIVDLATLTGACVVALGHHAIGLMTPSDALADALIEAGERSGERAWRLPLWPEYRKRLDSDIADIKNTGGRPGSVITAGWFLREFVDDGVEWAHLDIAGTAWAEEARGWHPKGATGVGVRLVHEWLRTRA